MLVSYSQRSGRLLLGLFLYALGSFLTIQANIGLAPWEAFGMGFARVGGISFGNAVVLSGFVIVVAAYLLNEKIGVGTLLNAVLIGTFVDLIQSAELIPAMANVETGIAIGGRSIRYLPGELFLYWCRTWVWPSRFFDGRNQSSFSSNSDRGNSWNDRRQCLGDRMVTWGKSRPRDSHLSTGYRLRVATDLQISEIRRQAGQA